MELITYRRTLDVHKNGIQFILQGFETNDNLSRRIEVSLMQSGDAVDFPLENVVAQMYITTPKAKEPSIEECTIVDNKIVYDVLPIAEEGITEMQIKIIGASVGGATRVLVSPRFAIEVTKSNADDGSAEQHTTFSALENAVAKASAIYNARLTKLEFDDNCIFRAYYADGTTYETDAIQKMLLQVTTDMDLTSLVKDGITNFTADELISALDNRYNYAFAKAIYSDNLAKVYDVPTFVRWDKDTANTPFNANPQLTEISDGFAMCYGDTLNHTIVAWTLGNIKNNCFMHTVSDGVTLGWGGYINKSGDAMTGSLILNADPTSDLEAATKRYVDGASMDSYYAFCANVNSDSIDCAFGKNNEDRIRMLGLQMAMYAWFKGDSKTEYPFTELIKCQTLNDLKNVQAFSELLSNQNLWNLFMRDADTIKLSYPSKAILYDLFRISESSGTVDIKTYTHTFTVTQEMLDGVVPVYMLYAVGRPSLYDYTFAKFYLNNVLVDIVDENNWDGNASSPGYSRKVKTLPVNWKDYNISSPGDYEIIINVKGTSNSDYLSTCTVAFCTFTD